MIKCFSCGEAYTEPDALYAHYEDEHPDEIPKDFTAAQYHYLRKTGKDHGSCVVCKKDTLWNPKTNKYSRFCPNPACKATYAAEAKRRMVGKYGRTHLLNDPEKQREMLANRAISGEYVWTDKRKVPYTGSYEKDFLQFLDLFMDYPSVDIMSPSPHTYYYIYEGEEKFYIPDVYIPSLDLEIEVKDGGTNPNNHHKIQQVDKEKERRKDEVMASLKTRSYIKIIDKKYETFFAFLEKRKENFQNNREEAIVLLESTLPIEEPVSESVTATSDELVPVYILLSHSGTMLANAIKSITKVPYSHSSISFDSKLDNMYSFGRKYKSNPLIGTFVKESIKEGLYEEVAKNATYSLYVTFVSPEQFERMNELLTTFRNGPGFKYDFTGLFKHKLGLESAREDAYFCSGFVATILQAGDGFFNHHYSRVSPYDFAKHKRFHFVAKGTLANYNQRKVDEKVETLRRKQKGGTEDVVY